LKRALSRLAKRLGSRFSSSMRRFLSFLPFLFGTGAAILLAGCGGGAPSAPFAPDSRLQALNLHLALLPPNQHGRLVDRTMRPRYITIHSTENPGATAAQHAHLLLASGRRSRNNPRFGRSGWITWHYTVDDQGIYEHLLPTEQGDHADYGGLGDTESIGIEICEFRDPARQAAAIDRAARLTATLADQFAIPTSNIVPHMHWPRWDYKYGKPCPHILLLRDPHAPGGWRLADKWTAFIAQADRYR
jgi:N-acetylmuramoyl-L-alanine amidase